MKIEINNENQHVPVNKSITQDNEYEVASQWKLMWWFHHISFHCEATSYSLSCVIRNMLIFVINLYFILVNLQI